MSAAVQVVLQAEESGSSAEAAALAEQGSAAADQLFGYPLAAAQLATVRQGALHDGHPLPDATSYALLAELCGLARQYKQLAELVMGAVQRTLPLGSVSRMQGLHEQGRLISELPVEASSHGGSLDSRNDIDSSSRSRGSISSWDDLSLQEFLAGAAVAWRRAGCGDVVPVLLDGFMAAGGRRVSDPRLAQELEMAAEEHEQVSGACLE